MPAQNDMLGAGRPSGKADGRIRSWRATLQAGLETQFVQPTVVETQLLRSAHCARCGALIKKAADIHILIEAGRGPNEVYHLACTPVVQTAPLERPQ